MKKETEIQLLTELKAIVADKSSYLSDLFTPQMVDTMIQNITVDHPINSGLPLVTDEAHKEMELEHAKTASKLRILNDMFRTRLDEILNDLVIQKNYDAAYKHFDTVHVMKSKLMYDPESLTESEKQMFLNAIS